jgi:hypothetical protein
MTATRSSGGKEKNINNFEGNNLTRSIRDAIM